MRCINAIPIKPITARQRRSTRVSGTTLTLGDDVTFAVMDSPIHRVWLVDIGSREHCGTPGRKLLKVTFLWRMSTIGLRPDVSTVSSTYARAARYFVSARPSKRWTDRLSPTGGSGREPDCRIQRRPRQAQRRHGERRVVCPETCANTGPAERIRLVEQRG